MADLLKSGLTWLGEKLTANAVQTVTYRRTVQSVAIAVMLDEQMLRVSDRQGNSKVERPDLAINFDAAKLNFGEGVVEPANGDLIDVTYGSETKRFRVMPINNGLEPGWHYLDPHQLRVAVFAKRIGSP